MCHVSLKSWISTFKVNNLAKTVFENSTFILLSNLSTKSILLCFTSTLSRPLSCSQVPGGHTPPGVYKHPVKTTPPRCDTVSQKNPLPWPAQLWQHDTQPSKVPNSQCQPAFMGSQSCKSDHCSWVLPCSWLIPLSLPPSFPPLSLSPFLGNQWLSLRERGGFSPCGRK